MLVLMVALAAAQEGIWTKVARPTNDMWNKLEMSSNGEYHLGMTDNGVYRSTDYGLTWTQALGKPDTMTEKTTTQSTFSAVTWNDIAMSSSGKHQAVIAGGNGGVF